MFPVQTYGDSLPNYRKVRAGDNAWFVPEEVPIAFVYNRRNYAVMMGTPDDLVDFALGFSLTEQVVRSADEIISLDIQLSSKGVDLRFKVTGAALERLDVTQRRRNMVGSASCGLCGLENADVLFKRLPEVSEVPKVLAAPIITQAFDAMWEHQALAQKTRTVHGAAWVSDLGQIEMLREDVGRHNALDKLLGAITQQDVDVSNGFVLMSSRCSYEIIEKAARCGVQALVSISAPTAFALEKAKQAGMSLYCRDGHGAVRLA